MNNWNGFELWFVVFVAILCANSCNQETTARINAQAIVRELRAHPEVCRQ
jgi:hypothetical protein